MWALGMVLYITLTGNSPYSHELLQDIKTYAGQGNFDKN
jgi:hypothetical protein